MTERNHGNFFFRFSYLRIQTNGMRTETTIQKSHNTLFIPLDDIYLGIIGKIKGDVLSRHLGRITKQGKFQNRVFSLDISIIFQRFCDFGLSEIPPFCLAIIRSGTNFFSGIPRLGFPELFPILRQPECRFEFHSRLRSISLLPFLCRFLRNIRISLFPGGFSSGKSNRIFEYLQKFRSGFPT